MTRPAVVVLISGASLLIISLAILRPWRWSVWERTPFDACYERGNATARLPLFLSADGQILLAPGTRPFNVAIVPSRRQGGVEIEFANNPKAWLLRDHLIFRGLLQVVPAFKAEMHPTTAVEGTVLRIQLGDGYGALSVPLAALHSNEGTEHQ